MNEKSQNNSTLLTPEAPKALDVEDVLLRAPLYTAYAWNDYPDCINYLYRFDRPLDVYCPSCERHSVFKRSSVGTVDPQQGARKLVKFFLRFNCSRDSDHELFFVFLNVQGALHKVGQFPSIADLADTDSLKYAKLLGKERFGDFKRATGLAAHGIGVGSFVYLRRIFEGLIVDAYNAARAGAAWDETAWQQARMDEKILLLKDQLPDFLVAQRAIYGILSRGVHELSEQECMAHFEVVKGAIEIILDAKLEQQAKAEKQAKVEKLMQAAHQALKK